MSRSLDLPEPIYRAILEAAEASVLSPADWIASKLPEARHSPTPEERRRALSRLMSQTVALGHPYLPGFRVRVARFFEA